MLAERVGLESEAKALRWHKVPAASCWGLKSTKVKILTNFLSFDEFPGHEIECTQLELRPLFALLYLPGNPHPLLVFRRIYLDMDLVERTKNYNYKPLLFPRS